MFDEHTKIRCLFSKAVVLHLCGKKIVVGREKARFERDTLRLWAINVTVLSRAELPRDLYLAHEREGDKKKGQIPESIVCKPDPIR